MLSSRSQSKLSVVLGRVTDDMVEPSITAAAAADADDDDGVRC